MAAPNDKEKLPSAGTLVSTGFATGAYQALKKAVQTGSKAALKTAAKRVASAAGPTVLLDDMLDPSEANAIDDVAKIKSFRYAAGKISK